MIDYYQKELDYLNQKDRNRVDLGISANTNSGRNGKSVLLYRPKAIEIWKNRKLNIRNHDLVSQGWGYKKNKLLDLSPNENYDVLTVHEKKPTILSVVNVHDELPEGMK